MANLFAFLLFVALLGGAELLIRYRARVRLKTDVLEKSADTALATAMKVGERRTARASIPPMPPPQTDRDETPVIALHARKARRVPTEYRMAHPASKKPT